MEEQTVKAIITEDAYKQLLQLCMKAKPLEACGLLASSYTPSDAPHSSKQLHHAPIIDIIIPITNIHDKPEHAFTFDPVEWTAAYYRMQTNQQSLVGLFHSHPLTEAVPSRSDTEGFLPASELSYWIISLKDVDQPDVKPYRRIQGVFHELQLMIT